jgi:selenocysteine lyase/cysteine desulfurase
MPRWSARWRAFLEEHPSLLLDLPQPLFHHSATTPEELARDEAFWQEVARQFPAAPGFSNLNSGACSVSPFVVEKAFTHYYSLMNQAPSYYIWKVMEQGRELIRAGLAQRIGADAGEVAILRNTTEALNNVIFGLDLQRTDEVVLCRLDYSKAVSSWKQRELREGICLKWVDLAGPEESDEAIVAKYVACFSPRTRLVQLTHVINWNGQVLPVKQIIAEAKKRNIEVLLDGAHSFGLLETNMQDLGCDYFTTALHKWLSGPIPSAMLFVAKDKIAPLWPLASSLTPTAPDIRKFEELSIQLLPNVLALGYALEFQEALGRENKEQRLRYLRRIFTEALEQHEQIRVLTPLQENRCCAITTLSLEGWRPAELESALFKGHQLHVGTVVWESLQGIRITPSVYTLPAELLKTVEALHALQLQTRAAE